MDVQRKNLTDSPFFAKQSKKLKKQQAKLLIDNQRTYNVNKLRRLSLRVEFIDCDMTRQCKYLET